MLLLVSHAAHKKRNKPSWQVVVADADPSGQPAATGCVRRLLASRLVDSILKELKREDAADAGRGLAATPAADSPRSGRDAVTSYRLESERGASD
jgi:hypothetical protein